MRRIRLDLGYPSLLFLRCHGSSLHQNCSSPYQRSYPPGAKLLRLSLFPVLSFLLLVKGCIFDLRRSAAARHAHIQARLGRILTSRPRHLNELRWHCAIAAVPTKLR
jgi:hypothetical protein